MLFCMNTFLTKQLVTINVILYEYISDKTTYVTINVILYEYISDKTTYVTINVILYEYISDKTTYVTKQLNNQCYFV